MKDSDVLLQWINDNYESTTNIKDKVKLKDVFNLVKDSENLTDMKKAEKRVITYDYFQSKLLANLFLSKLVSTNSDKTYCLYKIKVAEKHKIEQINNKILQKFLLFESGGGQAREEYDDQRKILFNGVIERAKDMNIECQRNFESSRLFAQSQNFFRYSQNSHPHNIQFKKRYSAVRCYHNP